jgi:hypothetical protein
MIPEQTSYQSSSEPGNDVENFVSAWRLNTWAACPLKYRFKYVDEIAFPPAVDEFVNKMVYAGLEHFYRQKQADEAMSPAELASHVRDRWHSAAHAAGVRFITAKEERIAREQMLGLLAAYLNRVAPDERRPLEVKRRLETPLVDPLTGEDLGLRLAGIIDLVLPESNGPLIVAFKVKGRAPARLEVAHEVQFACNAFLLRHAYDGLPEAGFEVCHLVKTKAPQIIWHRYAARQEVHFLRLFAMIRSYLDDFRANRFVFRPGPACSRCDFRAGACQDWSG